jgi:hypothetical protein
MFQSISGNFPRIFGIFRIFFVAYMDYLAISGLFFFTKMYSENKKKFLIFFFKPFFLKSARTPSTPRPAPTRRSNPPARPRACHGAHLARAAPHPTGTLAGVRHHHTADHPSQVRNDLSLPRPLKPQPPRPVSRVSPCAAALESEPSQPVCCRRFTGVKPTGGSRRRQELRKVEPHLRSLFPARTSRRSAAARGDRAAAAPRQRKKKKTLRFCNLAPVFSCNL